MSDPVQGNDRERKKYVASAQESSQTEEPDSDSKTTNPDKGPDKSTKYECTKPS